jgi:ketosteroid isomerase-like protein
MKQFLVCFCFAAFLLSCNSDEKTAATSATSPDSTKNTTPADLPYTASYSSSFSTDVSDADLKTVLMSYKDWADSNITDLSKLMGDSVTVEMSSGEHFSGSNAELMKKWSTYRDSLSAVKIDMQSWQKMYSTDKKEAYIVTWYEETDTYKNGKVDSAFYHDINQLKNGKITWYSQYKRPKK